MLRKPHDDRRSEEKPRDAVLLDGLQERLQLEPGHGDDRRAPVEAHVHDHGHSVDVEERENGDQLLLASDVEHGAGLHKVGDEVAVGEHHALREARCSARVGQHDEVLGGVDRGCRRLPVDEE